MKKEKMPDVSRPLPITVVVYSLFVTGIAQILYSFTGAIAGYGRFYAAAQVLLTIVMFAALSGVLMMEKWGLWLFLVVASGRIFLDLFSGAPLYYALFLLIPVGIFLYYIRKMNR